MNEYINLKLSFESSLIISDFLFKKLNINT